ncbi:MAG: sugar phosphate isomerase/epimerase family protein [Acidobacteriota bacterium]
MDDLCVTGALTLTEWIDMSRTLGVDGLELYSGFLDLQHPAEWPRWRGAIEAAGMTAPMMCCSPDFTHPDAAFRAAQVTRQQQWITMTAALGGQYCRVLSGQRRPELSIDQGIALTVECITTCLPHAAAHSITLVLENHYKDNYWTFPEFAQQMDVFCAIVEGIDGRVWPNFGVNFDPSNAILAGDDPLALLDRVKHRVKTMHASDRYLASGTLDDLRREEDSAGYAARLRHGEVGRGLNNYDAIFAVLHDAGFDGWISIEDGIEGLEQLARSVTFVRKKIAEHWTEQPHPDAPRLRSGPVSSIDE